MVAIIMSYVNDYAQLSVYNKILKEMKNVHYLDFEVSPGSQEPSGEMSWPTGRILSISFSGVD